MVFLFVHFGKNKHTGWRLARDIFGRLGGPQRWNWARVSANPMGIRDWLSDNLSWSRKIGQVGKVYSTG